MDGSSGPSRTAILTAAARAFGSREPDASVRNPDWLADRLIGPDELALIGDHPIAGAMSQDFQQAINDPEVFGFTWLMLVRTRCIDEWTVRAARGGATQIVIVGAGFDTRARRLRDALNGAVVYEVDHPATQDYKRRRVDTLLPAAADVVVYVPADLTRDDLSAVLRRAGWKDAEPTYFVCEGLSMYVPEEGMKATLRAMAGAGRGSAVMLEYLNRGGLDLLVKYPSGTIKNAFGWGEPFVFGVPDGQDREFFFSLGLELGDTLKIGGRESVRRYAMCADGRHYGAHLAAAMQQRREAALAAMDEEGRRQAEQVAATSGYWLAELQGGLRP